MVKLERGKVYRVSSGTNYNFTIGDVFYIDPRDGALVCPGSGWLDENEVNESMFTGVTVEGDISRVVVLTTSSTLLLKVQDIYTHAGVL